MNLNKALSETGMKLKGEQIHPSNHHSSLYRSTTLRSCICKVYVLRLRLELHTSNALIAIPEPLSSPKAPIIVALQSHLKDMYCSVRTRRAAPQSSQSPEGHCPDHEGWQTAVLNTTAQLITSMPRSHTGLSTTLCGFCRFDSISDSWCKHHRTCLNDRPTLIRLPPPNRRSK